MKNTEKHTKGEWKIAQGGWTSRNRHAMKVLTKDSYIAEILIEGKKNKKFSEQEANARLIAAAPEMLERLKYVVSWLEDANVHKTFVKHFKDTIKKATE